MHPNPRVRVQKQRVRRHAEQSDAYAFFNLSTAPELLDTVESLLPVHKLKGTEGLFFRQSFITRSDHSFR